MNKTLFGSLIKILDDNVAIFVMIAAIFGAIMRDGDLMQRSKAGVVGSVGTLAIWQIARKIVDI